jgi:chromate transporter
VVAEAVLRIGRRALKNRTLVAISAAAFVAIFFFHVPFPLIVLGAALIGVIGRCVWPVRFPLPTSAHALADGDFVIDQRIARGELAHEPIRAAIAGRVIREHVRPGPFIGADAHQTSTTTGRIIGRRPVRS